MGVIAIGTREGADELRRLLESACGQAGLGLQVKVLNRAPWTFLLCSFQGGSDPNAAGRRAAAGAVGTFVVGPWQDRMVKRLIATRYPYFHAGELKAISALARRLLGAGSPSRGSGWRCERIVACADAYLAQHDALIVEGFVTFRLPAFTAEVEAAVDQAVDEFLLEREYEEFVQLLRHFVEQQSPHAERTHAVWDENGSFALIDDHGHRLREDVLAEVGDVGGGADLTPEDLLVSALVALAPRSVVLHAPWRTLEAEKTLRKIFGARFSLCSGCNLCRQRGAGRRES